MRISLAVLFIFVFGGGCATYQQKVSSARRALFSGNPGEAVEKLKPLAFQESRDQLIYLMDYGLATHMSGDYAESNKAFLLAADLAEFQDYHSISKITESLLFAEEMVQYKGEAYENLLIQYYLAINFLKLGQLDNAVVSARKINEIMEKYRIDAKAFEAQNVMAHYLSALLWEAQGDRDSAVIEYERAFKLNPSHPQIQRDVLRANFLADRMTRYQELKKQFDHLAAEKDWEMARKRGELIVLYSQGWAPRKRPHPNSPRLPMLSPVSSTVKSARARIEEIGDYESIQIYSVEDVAMNTLAKDYDELVAKRLAGVATKAVVSDQIRQKNELLGDLAWIAMNVADRADVRQWSTLPETYQVIRIPLEPGEYRVTLEGLTLSGLPIEETAKTIKIQPDAKEFMVWRSFQ